MSSESESGKEPTKATSEEETKTKAEETPAAKAAPPPAAVPAELLVKHPLQHRWVLWYLKNDRTKQWEDCLKEVATFDTVEDFWALYNHIQLASGLGWGSDYYLFKEGIRPMWEDKANVQGGRWLVQVEKNRRTEVLDQYWLELLMAMIGEQFEDLGEEICGAVVNIRNKGDKVSLWTRNAALESEMNKKMGLIVKQKLDLHDQTLKFEVHKDSSNKTSSIIKPLLTV